MEAPVNDLHAPAPDGTLRAQTAAEAQLASLIVTALQLEVEPRDIAPDALLFNGGLGLDSIDALEMALAISREYGIELRSDDHNNRQVFASLASLSAYVEVHRPAPAAS